MSDARPAIVWFRNDLRIADNPALVAAVERGGPVIPVFFWAPENEGRWPPGAASRWWLHQSLTALDAELRKLGSRLIIRRGAAMECLPSLVDETSAEAVYWTRRYEPAIRERDEQLRSALDKQGIAAECASGALLYEPEAIRTQSGEPYQVFTAFWRACQKATEPAPPVDPPAKLAAPSRWPKSLELDELKLGPTIDWAAGFRAAWTPGERGAQQQLDRFLADALDEYPAGRDVPSEVGTSRLSPHLHFGEISVRQIWYVLRAAKRASSSRARAMAIDKFASELGWREFANHLLFHFPHTPEQPLREQFANFPWAKDGQLLRAWQRGRTGYPIVDAGMRELWRTGWMHNRVRMIVASFLVKDLLISWQEGAAWFWDTLVDANLANNTLGWQWTAGCGADAAPYFRIFNPVLQGEKFDPEGEYVRRWVPELAKLRTQWIHQPWEAPPLVLAAADIVLGKSYPRPIVDHAAARARALEALKSIKG